MALVSLSTYDIVKSRWNYKEHKYDRELKQDWKAEHTYMVVFGPNQEDKQEVFEKEFKGRILHKSKRACNINYRNGPRNTLFIFEVDE